MVELRGRFLLGRRCRPAARQQVVEERQQKLRQARTGGTGGQLEHALRDEVGDLVLEHQHVVLDQGQSPVCSHNWIILLLLLLLVVVIAIGVGLHEQNLDDEAGVEEQHLHEGIAVHVDVLGVGRPRPGL
ncbi:UPF0481 protein-like [Iris pallida]|uniref:UPF0481 protein-like n=1 Tax=Iris pallida TaxID=29817 RepID=A0AAX6FQP0_IRIPA|nr:UPF0481 protein-like [Iris pallida]